MKKQNLISAILICISITGTTFLFSQTGKGPVTPVRLGSVILNVGAGAGADYKNHYYNTAFGTKAALEFGLWQAGPGVITLGPELGASFSNGGYYSGYRSNIFVIAARSAWHYGWKVRGLDTYGGLSAGVGFHHYGVKNNNENVSDVIPVAGGFVGASYFISPKFGFNAEAGFDITQFQLGVVFKLK